ncbi:MAG TPA: NAD(P)-dependent oxidoreductase, partial [Alphaproteobacteria bacterium]|nr:NAD(P)-dependent oxidoreductase [Alphaproteobacteria bacterium]
MVAILFQCPWESAGDWLAALGAAMPAEEVRLYPDELGDPAEIEVALVWKPPHGLLTGLPKLRAILALGAGVDALLRDADLPAGVPLARLVDPSMPTRMAEYVAGAVLYYHLHHDVYAARQARGEWLREPPRDAAGRRVGLLGLGAMGLAAARALTGLGFAVAGWRRADAAVPGL